MKYQYSTEDIYLGLWLRGIFIPILGAIYTDIHTGWLSIYKVYYVEKSFYIWLSYIIKLLVELIPKVEVVVITLVSCSVLPCFACVLAKNNSSVRNHTCFLENNNRPGNSKVPGLPAR